MADGELARVGKRHLGVVTQRGARPREALVQEVLYDMLELGREVRVAPTARYRAHEVEVLAHQGEGAQDGLVGEQVHGRCGVLGRRGEKRLLEAGYELVLELLKHVVLVNKVQVEGAAVDSCPPRDVGDGQGVEALLAHELYEGALDARACLGGPCRTFAGHVAPLVLLLK